MGACDIAWDIDCDIASKPAEIAWEIAWDIGSSARHFGSQALPLQAILEAILAAGLHHLKQFEHVVLGYKDLQI